MVSRHEASVLKLNPDPEPYTSKLSPEPYTSKLNPEPYTLKLNPEPCMDSEPDFSALVEESRHNKRRDSA